MRRGRQLTPLSVTSEERESLERWTRRPKTGQALAQRARIILESATGKSNTEVARRLRVTNQMVGEDGECGFWKSASMVCWTSRDQERRADSVMRKSNEC